MNDEVLVLKFKSLCSPDDDPVTPQDLINLVGLFALQNAESIEYVTPHYTLSFFPDDFEDNKTEIIKNE